MEVAGGAAAADRRSAREIRLRGRLLTREGMRGAGLYAAICRPHARPCAPMVQHGDLRQPRQTGGSSVSAQDAAVEPAGRAGCDRHANGRRLSGTGKPMLRTDHAHISVKSRARLSKPLHPGMHCCNFETKHPQDESPRWSKGAAPIMGAIIILPFVANTSDGTLAARFQCVRIEKGSSCISDCLAGLFLSCCSSFRCRLAQRRTLTAPEPDQRLMQPSVIQQRRWQQMTGTPPHGKPFSNG